MASNLQDMNPILSKWVIKYDDFYQMPQFVQGIVIGDSKVYKDGTTVLINNIESVDFMNKLIKTSDGSVFNFVGKGKRMIVVPEDESSPIIVDYEEDEYI